MVTIGVVPGAPIVVVPTVIVAGPAGPVGPVAPVAPVGPDAPVGPVGPAHGPVGPVGPVGPKQQVGLHFLESLFIFSKAFL